MVNWFIIILVIAAVLLIIKAMHLRHFKHRVFAVILILLVLFLASTIYLVSDKNEIDMTTANGFYKGIQVYGGWLSHSFQNVKVLTGNAINMDWTSVNGSFFDKNTKKDTKKSGSKTIKKSKNN